VAISELLIVNDNIRKMIVNHERSNVIQQEAMKNGMKTLWQDGLAKVLAGVTSLNELERVIDMDELISNSKNKTPARRGRPKKQIQKTEIQNPEQQESESQA
jgi:hypothetical protein